MSNATYELRITGTHYNQFVENVFHFQGDLATGVQPYTEGMDLIDSFLQTSAIDDFRACLPPTYLVDRLSARCILPAGPSQGPHQQVINANYPGTSGTAAASENLCPVMNLIPPMGVKTQGRVYMPCIAKEDINNNQYQSGYIAAMTTFFDGLITGIAVSATTWKLAIYSRKLGSSSLAQAHTLSAAIGYQGKRRRPI